MFERFFIVLHRSKRFLLVGHHPSTIQSRKAHHTSLGPPSFFQLLNSLNQRIEAKVLLFTTAHTRWTRNTLLLSPTNLRKLKYERRGRPQPEVFVPKGVSTPRLWLPQRRWQKHTGTEVCNLGIRLCFSASREWWWLVENPW